MDDGLEKPRGRETCCRVWIRQGDKAWGWRERCGDSGGTAL